MSIDKQRIGRRRFEALGSNYMSDRGWLPGATELQHITDAVEAYEIKRWPRGKVPGGKD